MHSIELPFPPTPENGEVLAAVAVNRAWEAARIELDYSVASLKKVDAILEDFRRRGYGPHGYGGTRWKFW